MADEETHASFSSSDYEAIEAAVMETARGRWFLREYAKRNRNADTALVLEAVDRLKETVVEERTARAMGRIRADLQDMASAIRQTKHDFGTPVSDADSAERRIRRIVETLRYLEGRINAMIAICDREDTSAEGHAAGAERDVIAPGPNRAPAFLM